jgi:hypothetical protein
MKFSLINLTILIISVTVESSPSVKIVSTPDSAEVLINYKLRGITPLQLTDLPKTQYSLMLKKVNYLPLNILMNDTRKSSEIRLNLIHIDTLKILNKEAVDFPNTKYILNGLSLASIFLGSYFSEKTSKEFTKYVDGVYLEFDPNPDKVKSISKKANLMLYFGLTNCISNTILNILPSRKNKVYYGNQKFQFILSKKSARQKHSLINAAIYFGGAFLLSLENSKIEKDEDTVIWDNEFSDYSRKNTFEISSQILFGLGLFEIGHVLYLELNKPQIYDFIEFIEK